MDKRMIDRNEYLKLCQKCSVYVSAGQEIPPELLVKYDNISYYPKAYELSFINGKAENTAILGDLKANSVIYARLERIER